jgi:iron complex outermembrane receptor protein
LQTSLTLFQYRQSDIIQYVTDPGPNGTATAQNTGDQTGRGFELEASWHIGSQWRISGNYSYQRATDQASGKDAGLSPHHHVFLRSDWHFATLWQAGISLNHVAQRLRQPGDTRPPLADYTSVDVNVRREKLWGNWEWQLAVKNLFNRDVREPSLAPGNIPLDLPQPGRNWQLQLTYKF